MAFQRKFQDGSVVVLSNPNAASMAAWRSRFNETVTVTGYVSGDDHPYVLSNGTRARVDEIMLAAAPAPVASKEEELDTTEFPKPTVEVKPIVPIDYFIEAYKLLDLQLGDVVNLKFLVSGEQATNLGANYTVDGWMNDLTSQKRLSKLIGKKVIVTDSNPYGYITFQQEDGSAECWPMIGLELVKRSVKVAEFQASSDRKAIVTDSNVIIDSIIFDFAFFDKLWAYIKEHQLSPKTGDARSYPICSRYRDGVLHSNYIKVGCQVFYFKDVKRLMAAIRVARSVK